MQKVFVVIVTYNGSRWIDKCFGSVINAGVSSKVLAVDNNSSDNTPSIIRKKFPEVEVIETGKNLGFGAANNLGIKRALSEGAEFIFLLNQDAWLSPGSLEKLVDGLSKNKDYGILSPIHLNGTGDMLDRNFADYLIKYGGRKFITDKICGRPAQKIFNIEYVNAAAWLVSKACIEKVGFFDPVFFHYGEDDNYLQRVRYHLFKVGVLTNTFVYHDRENNEIKKVDFENRLRLFKTKWANVNLEEQEIRNDIEKELRYRYKLMWLSLIRLKIQNYRLLRFEIDEIKRISRECLESRKRNRNELI